MASTLTLSMTRTTIRTQKLTRSPLPATSARRWASLPSLANRLKRAPRRLLLLGLGALMASSSLTGSGGGSLSASARLQPGAIERVLMNVEWPDEFPFKGEDFTRFDESPDTLFYSEPRFVTHIDDPAIAALTKYYSKVFPPSNTPGVCLLDMCSSWISHYPPGYRQDRIVGMGLNEDELKRNPILTEYVVQDLNVNPILPFHDNSFDVISNVLSDEETLAASIQQSRSSKPPSTSCRRSQILSQSSTPTSGSPLPPRSSTASTPRHPTTFDLHHRPLLQADHPPDLPFIMPHPSDHPPTLFEHHSNPQNPSPNPSSCLTTLPTTSFTFRSPSRPILQHKTQADISLQHPAAISKA